MDAASNRRAIEEAIRRFPAMPALCQDLMTGLHNPDADMQALAGKVQYDPGMTANVLKLANSAVFGASRRIDSLQTAFVRLGAQQLLQMVVLSGMTKFLRAPMAGYGLRPDELLSHSLWVAVAAEELARTLWVPAPAMAFTAGLLHDIGKVVLDEFIRQNWDELEGQIREAGALFDRVENNVLGMNHPEAGAMVLDHWNLPDVLVACVRWHHEPLNAKEHSRVAAMVHVADGLSYSQGIGAGVDGFRYEQSQEVIATLGLRPSTLERVASRVLDRVQEVEKILKG